MKLILLISIISLVSSQDYDNDWVVEDGDIGYDDDLSGDETKSTTTQQPIITKEPIVIVKETDHGIIGAILGGISAGTGIIYGLVLLGRRFCKKTTKEKNDRDLDVEHKRNLDKNTKKDLEQDLDYDYYGIMQKRYNYADIKYDTSVKYDSSVV
jgi:hypothetical protein